MNWKTALFTLVYKNDMFAFSGFVNLQCKNRFPIPQGDMSLLFKRIRSDFQARLARFKQLGYEDDDVFLHLILSIAELVRSVGILVQTYSKCLG